MSRNSYGSGDGSGPGESPFYGIVKFLASVGLLTLIVGALILGVVIGQNLF